MNEDAKKEKAEDLSMPSTASLLLKFLQGNGGSHSFISRFLTTLWGCLVLHISLIAFVNAHSVITAENLQNYGQVLAMAILVYSCIYAVIVAVGVPKGSLVRHFVYGITLPSLCYFLAGNITKIILE